MARPGGSTTRPRSPPRRRPSCCSPTGRCRATTPTGDTSKTASASRWVAARVREARMAGVAGGMDRKVADSRRRILRSLEERRRTLADPAKAAELDRQIAEVRRLLQGAPPEVPEAVRDNAELVA